MSEHESEVISDSQGGNRKLWVTAKEVAGLEGMPTTDRRTRDILDEWAKGKEGARRKRSGTKAFEYHISVLPKAVRDQLSPPNQGGVAAASVSSGVGLGAVMCSPLSSATVAPVTAATLPLLSGVATAAAQWQRIQRTKRAMPYLLYQLGPRREACEQHLQWDGVLLPVDDPWWRTHFPPNSNGCTCAVRQVSKHEHQQMVASGKARTNATGDGVEPGWDFTPGLITPGV